MVDGIEAYKNLRVKLENPPSQEEMLADLKMNNVSIRQKDGNIQVLRVADKTILERIWKSYQINTFIQSTAEGLVEEGVPLDRMLDEAHNLAEELLKNKTPTEGSRMEGFVDEGFLEIEVFAKERRTKN